MAFFWIYILTSNSGTLYTGSTDDLRRRVLQHRQGIHSRFVWKYDCHRLVHYEQFHSAGEAMARERQIKGWTRAKKIALIEATNHRWRDLARDWIE